MKPSFCAIANRQSGEDLIGTASRYQTYVLIECPLPWAAKAFNSKQIPSALRQYVKAVKAERSIQFLTVSRARPSESVTLMVYEQQLNAQVMKEYPVRNYPVQNYRGYEFQLDNLEQVVDCLEAHWQGSRIGKAIQQKDVLICTHGMRDKCCARFGQLLFREATRSVKQGELPNTRVWKVSHIGGHRFAPTAIVLPDGRYYGRLTLEALQSIAAGDGSDIQLEKLYREMYRGWGLLPAPLQPLERMLLLRHGWAWLKSSVSYRILSERTPESLLERLSEGTPERTLEKTLEKTPNKQHELSVEISVTLPNAQSATIYQAELFQDPEKTLCLKASCSSAIASPMTKYTVAECVLMTPAVETSKRTAKQNAENAETLSVG